MVNRLREPLSGIVETDETIIPFALRRIHLLGQGPVEGLDPSASPDNWAVMRSMRSQPVVGHLLSPGVFGNIRFNDAPLLLAQSPLGLSQNLLRGRAPSVSNLLI